MSTNFYDPWTHALNLFITRILQFFVLSGFFGIAIWLALLNRYFEVAIWETTKLAVTGDHNTSRAMFGLCLLAGSLTASWLFTYLIMRGRLRSGDRHHRGARVVTSDRDFL